jgi:hypothetical protein
MRKPFWLALGVAALATGCALYSEVVIGPLLLDPDATWRLTNNTKDLLEMGEYTRVIEVAKGAETRSKPNAKELAALGAAEMAAGRFDDARRHLRTALDLKPFRTELAEIAWNLSQIEYLTNNFDASHEWALMADRNGLQVRKWHLDFLVALTNVETYRIEGARSATVKMVVTNPEIPRIDVEVLGTKTVTGVIDSGAVLSIISTELAAELGVRQLGTSQGTFYGLLGEPIAVSFGLIDKIRIGEMTIRDVPVAVMPDQKLNFVVLNREPFNMRLLLGANLLKEFRIELDYVGKEVTMDALSSGERIPAQNQNLFFVGFRPFVHGAINGHGWYLFVLDTGSEITFLNSEQVETTVLRNFPKFHGATLQGLGGSRKTGSKVQNVELGFDRWAGRFRDIPLYSTEHSNALGIVGEDFLSNFRVVIDFGSMRLDLHRERALFRPSRASR